MLRKFSFWKKIVWTIRSEAGVQQKYFEELCINWSSLYDHKDWSSKNTITIVIELFQDNQVDLDFFYSMPNTIANATKAELDWQRCHHCILST